LEEKKKFNPLAKDWIMGKAGEKESQAKDESPVETVDESVESEGKKKFNPLSNDWLIGDVGKESGESQE
tara:strand:- start:75 stop:281 length:207 start_codon:yes stop_codon:yes gene_type:complete